MPDRKNLPVLSACLVFLSSFYVYLITLAPTVYFGDSGELISMAGYLGIPHPTGFPLYMLFSKLTLTIPFANPAFRVNLISAVFSGLAASFFFLTALKLTGNRLKGLLKYLLPALLALVFAFSYTNWSQSVVARIYTMNAFFCAAALYLLMVYEEKPLKKYLYLLGFITGLGAGLHLSFIIFSGLIWGYLLFARFKTVKTMIPAVFGFIALGASCYLYIFMRGLADTGLKWQDFSGLQSFMDYFTQKQYRSKMAGRNLQGYIDFFSYIFPVILKDFSIFGFIASLAGCAVTYFKKIKFRHLLLLIFLSNIALLALYGNYSDMKLAFRYLIPSFMISAVYLVYLSAHILDVLETKKYAPVPVIAISALLIVMLFAAGWRENNRSNNYIARNYAFDMAAGLPEKAALFTSGDNQIYPLAYVKFAEKKLAGITVYDIIPTVFKDIKALAEKSGTYGQVGNIIQGFKDGIGPMFTVMEISTNMFFQPQHGFVHKLNDGTAEPELYPFRLLSYKGILRDKIFYTFEEREVVGTYYLKLANYYKLKGDIKKLSWSLLKSTEEAYDSLPVLGNAALMFGTIDAIENGPQKSEELFLKAAKLNPYSDSIQFNLGSFYARQGRLSDAAERYEAALKINPANMNAKMYLSRIDEQIAQIQAQQAAEAEQNKALSLKRNSYHLAGLNFLKDNIFDRAIEEFSKDIEQNPDIDRGYFHVALAYSRMNDLNKAIPFYEQALSKAPDNTSTLNNLGICYHGVGNKKKAKELLEKSLKINPNQDRVKKMLEELK